MSVVQDVMRRVYLAPTARRHFFTKKAAIRAEARARIKAKYPTEEPEYDETGRATYAGYHWANEPRLLRLYDRLTRLLSRKEAA